MKKSIHPAYFETPVRCACGHAFSTGSTQHVIKVEVCSHCHPAYTGVRRVAER